MTAPKSLTAAQQKIAEAPLKEEIKELKKELKEAHAGESESEKLEKQIAKLKAENKALHEKHDQADAERQWRMSRGLPT